MAKPLKLEVLLGAIDKATGPLKKITQGSGKTAQALKASRDELRSLEAAQKDLRAFRDMKRQAGETSEALETQRREVAELSRQLRTTDGDTAALNKERDKAIRKAKELADKYERQTDSARQLKRGLRETHNITGKLAGSENSLAKKIRAANNQLEAQQRELSETARRQRQAADAAKRYQRATTGASGMAGTGAAGAAVGGVALTAMGTQALGNQAHGARLAAQFGEGSEAAERYRRVITDVYRSGRGEGLGAVAQAVGALGAAFGSLEETSSKQLQAITQRALTLSDVFGIDIADAAQTAGIMVQNGLAKDATAAFDLLTRGFQNVSVSMRDELPEILHEYSTNFRALGLDGKQAMNLLVAAADQGKFALDKTGDALKEFTIRGTDMSKASVAAYESVGLNAEQMANAIASGGDRAHDALLLTARSLLDIDDPARRANTAIALFGTPIEDLSVDQIPQFLKALSSTEDRLGNVAGATKEMGETLDNNASDALKRIQRAISGTFMSALDGAQDEIIAVSKAITGWIKENPELASTLAKAAAAIAALVAVGGTLMAVLGSILGPIAMVRYALTLLSLNPASLTIMAIVAAVAALAAGAYLVYRNWGAISDWFKQRWETVKAAFSEGISGVARLLLNWNPVSLLYRGITAGLSALGVQIPEQFQSLGTAIIDGLIGGLSKSLGKLKNSVTGLAGKVGGWFKETLGINSPSRVFAQYGGYTVDGLNAGLDAQRDEPAKRVRDIAKRVATAGAGIAIGTAGLPAVADIPIDRRPAMTASAPTAQATGDAITINVYGAPGQDERTLAQEIARVLEQRDREKAARNRSSMRDID